jgi:multidrug efflux system outer membrane protein
MKKAALPLWLATSLLSPISLGQTAPAPTPPRPAPAAPTPPRPAPAPTAPAKPGIAPATTTTPGSPAVELTEPTLPNVEDAMLAPPPNAAHVLGSWREALALLRSKSPSLRTSLAQVDVARARARQAMAASLPTLAVGGGNTFISHEFIRGDVPVPNFQRLTIETRRMPDPPTTWGAGVNLRVPVFVPQAWYDKGTADDAIDYAKLNTKEAERQVVAGVADTIVVAVASEKVAEVSRVSLKNALSTLDLNKRRAALGASSALDVLRAEEEVQRARGQVVVADEGLIRAREALGLALGTADSWSVTPNIKLDALADDARASCRAEPDISRRTDVKAATANLRLAERQKGSVDWAYWPTVEAGSTFAYARNDFPSGKNFSWTVGAYLNWTLYDGGLRYGMKDEALANERIAREQLADTKRRAEQQVAQAFRAVHVAETNLGISSRAREIAAETARLARIQFMSGTGTSFDLVDRATRLAVAEQDLAAKQFEVLRARVAALLALASCDV